MVSSETSNARPSSARSTTVRQTPFTATDAPTSLSAGTTRQRIRSRWSAHLQDLAPFLNDAREHRPPPSGPARPARRDARSSSRAAAIGANPGPAEHAGRTGASHQLGGEVQDDLVEQIIAHEAPGERGAALHERRPERRACRACGSSSGRQTPPAGSRVQDRRHRRRRRPTPRRARRRARLGGRDQRGRRPVEEPRRRRSMRPEASTRHPQRGPRIGEARVAHGERRVVLQHRARAHDRRHRPPARRRCTSARASSPVIHRDVPSAAAVLPSRLSRPSSASRTAGRSRSVVRRPR